MNNVQRAVSLVKSISLQHPLYLGFSGGKDSVVLDWICREANIKVTKVYNNTTIDPPGTISFCLRNGAEIRRSELSFLDLVERKGMPTMFRRFCCQYLKEKFIGDYVLLGTRRAESRRRAECYSDFDYTIRYSKTLKSNIFLPLLSFTDYDISEIVRRHSLEMHPLYYSRNGIFDVTRRLGCIGCPLQSDRGLSEFLIYPKLLKQILKRLCLFHLSHGRSISDAVLNLVYNLFYSNHGYARFQQTYFGLFPSDPWDVLQSKFDISKDDFLRYFSDPKL